MVSKTNNAKVLKWFGPRKPTDEQVLHEERRVQYFKNKVYVKAHYRKNVPVRPHVKRVRRKKVVRYPNYK